MYVFFLLFPWYQHQYRSGPRYLCCIYVKYVSKYVQRSAQCRNTSITGSLCGGCIWLEALFRSQQLINLPTVFAWQMWMVVVAVHSSRSFGKFLAVWFPHPAMCTLILLWGPSWACGGLSPWRTRSSFSAVSCWSQWSGNLTPAILCLGPDRIPVCSGFWLILSGVSNSFLFAVLEFGLISGDFCLRSLLVSQQQLADGASL